MLLLLLLGGFNFVVAHLKWAEERGREENLKQGEGGEEAGEALQEGNLVFNPKFRSV